MQISVSPKVLPNIIAVSPWLFGTPFEPVEGQGMPAMPFESRHICGEVVNLLGLVFTRGLGLGGF